MKRRAAPLAIGLALVVGLLCALAPSLRAQQAKRPVYVGVKACAACHEGKLGDQVGHWRGTRHSKAYAALALPEAKTMAQLSGVPDPPEKAPICLGCHATAWDAEPWELDPTFAREDGVQCERCHGPGSEYANEKTMRDPKAAEAAGLRKLTKRDCVLCHYVKGSHAAVHHLPQLDMDWARERLAHPLPQHAAAAAPARPSPVATLETAPPRQADIGLGLDVVYKTPLHLAVRPGGKEVWAACEASGSVVVVDARTRAKVAEVASGGAPAGLAFSPDGKRAYVSNRLEDDVSVIDASARKVIAKIKVGNGPHGLVTDLSGKTLYVANTSGEDISVVDTAALKETKRLSASRYPWALSLSPDGKRIAVTNALSRVVGFREASLSEVTVIDTAKAAVVHRARVPEANLLLGVAWHPKGEFALFTLNRTKNLVPMTRLLQGWTITNGLGVLWKDGRVDQVLLDEPQRYFADAYDVAITPDGKYALATSSSTDLVAVLDVAKLVGMLQSASDDERANVIPNHLGKSADFVVARIPTRNSPRGITIVPDGKTAFVANALDDTLTVIDLKTFTAAGEVDLGGPKVITRVRRGERLFNSARIAFQRQFSCHTCHPDGHVDGLTYDIEADGIGVSPVDNRTLRGIYDTDPFKWEGTNATLARQCGPRLAVFFTRIDPFTKDELQAVNDYTVTVPRPPNPFRPVGAELTPAQRRGKLLFERTVANDGRLIPPDGRCVTCHFPPYYTDRSQRDVGTKYTYDRQGKFDVPHLNNIYDSAPYLHNGMAPTLEEIWTRFNPEDKHGVTNDMTKDQLNDLIEYLKTL